MLVDPTLSPPWFDSLDPALVARLLRPLDTPGIVPLRQARRILDWVRYFSGRLRMLDEVARRNGRAGGLRPADLPIVHARLVSPVVEPGVTPPSAEGRIVRAAGGPTPVPGARAAAAVDAPRYPHQHARAASTSAPAVSAHMAAGDVSVVRAVDGVPTLHATSPVNSSWGDGDDRALPVVHAAEPRQATGAGEASSPTTQDSVLPVVRAAVLREASPSSTARALPVVRAAESPADTRRSARRSGGIGLPAARDPTLPVMGASRTAPAGQTPASAALPRVTPRARPVSGVPSRDVPLPHARPVAMDGPPTPPGAVEPRLAPAAVVTPRDELGRGRPPGRHPSPEPPALPAGNGRTPAVWPEAAAVDIDDLTKKVQRRLLRHLAAERERKGGFG